MGDAHNISLVGLGLGSLHHLSSRRLQDRFLRSALDLGVTHFDAARLYGDGSAELALGRLRSSTRDNVTIATKFGLGKPSALAKWSHAAQPVRIARKQLVRARLSNWPEQRYRPDQMRQDLEHSLRSMNTDYIDYYFIHEPNYSTKPVLEDLVFELAEAKVRGEILKFGVAGSGAQKIAEQIGAFEVVQTSEAEWVEHQRHPSFTYSVRAAYPNLTAEEAFATAAHRRPHGGVIVGTKNTNHLASVLKVLAR